MIEIYARDNPPCAYCIAAVNLCEAKGLEYKKLVLDKDFSLEDFTMEFYNAKTFPQIKKDNKGIGGFDELRTAVIADQVRESIMDLSL
tara:strand:+ start:573 stop:836 length:264 start_codon:yes stop_codon:yes gene_type:complete